jgi:ABC-type uncharacterized transport system involved in gliding motility auxiliary subunit
MRLTQKMRRLLQLQNVVYYVLLVVAAGLLGWLSMRYSAETDWSANNRNTLNQASIDTLAQMPDPITVTVFISENQMIRDQFRNMYGRYQRHKADLQLNFINPDINPAETRAMGITTPGQTLIEYQGRQESPEQMTEEAITNALQRLARGQQRRIVFLTGHGERNPAPGDPENFGLGEFTKQLMARGFLVEPLNLMATPNPPTDIHLLVIASPQTSYLPAELKMLKQYVERGGNLLWLLEPGNTGGLESLAPMLGILPLPGVILDAASQTFGTQPDTAIVVSYGYSPITTGLSQASVFPQATGLISADENPLIFFGQPFLQTQAESWIETGSFSGEISFDEDKGDIPGPITVGMYLTRSVKFEGGEANTEIVEPADVEQRIAVVGDGDFLSNAYLGHGINLSLGLSIFNWLTQDDSFIDIAPIRAGDTQLHLGFTAAMVISWLFPVLLPLGLLLAGVAIWLKRRKR